jgi:hypothetical protein
MLLKPIRFSESVPITSPAPFAIDQVPSNLRSLLGQNHVADAMLTRTTTTIHRQRLRFGFGGMVVTAVF